mmetsp:Transcript_23947/g.77067  ORF Transcript_23947/g.77067 Transcript_23947/m.77067 type:complete len:289 (+) Transcript_23947:1292-2158(+)
MGLLHLVEEDDAVGPPPDGLRQLAAGFIADVTRRGSEEPRHGELLRVLAHVDAYKGIRVVEDFFREGLGELGFSDARGPQEREGRHGARRVAQSGLGPSHGVRDESAGVRLADDSFRKSALQVEQLLPLRIDEPRRRDARPGGDDARDVVRGHRVPDEPVLSLDIEQALRFRQVRLERRQDVVPDLRRRLEVVGLFGFLDLLLQTLELVLQGRHVRHQTALGVPGYYKIALLLAQSLELGVDGIDALLVLSFFLGRPGHGLAARRRQRQTFHFQLDDPPLGGLQGGGP